MKQIHRKNSIQNYDATLYLFDILPFESFKSGIEKKTYKERIKILNDWFSINIKIDKVKLIDKKFVNLDNDEGKEVLKILIIKQLLMDMKVL